MPRPSVITEHSRPAGLKRGVETRLLWTIAVMVTVALASLSGEMPSARAQEPPAESDPLSTPSPQVPDDGGTPAEPGGPLDLFPDPREWAGEVFNQVLVNLLGGVSGALRSTIDSVMSSSLNFITRTPPAGSYASPTVLALWGAVRTVANAALVLVIAWGGLNLILRPHLGLPYHEAMELFPRIALGALLANTSLSWAQLAIDANNALSSGLGQASLPAWERADTASQLLIDVFSTLIYLVTSLLLLLQMLMRLALIDVLLVVSPLALLCWVLPETQGWARLWSSTFFAAVFAQFVQVLALKLGGALLTELAPMSADAALLAIFLGIAVLVLTMRIPSLMRNHLGDGLGFARYFAYRQVAGVLEKRGGASRTGGGA